MQQRAHTKRPVLGGLLPVIVVLLLGSCTLAGCDSLLDVKPNTDTVPAEEINNPTSLDARITGTVANFWFAYDMAAVYGGLFTDELIDATGFDEIDERRVQPSNGSVGAADENPEGLDGLWTPMQRSAFTSNQLQQAILEGNFPDQIPEPQSSVQLARTSLYAGYSRLMLADLFCSLAFGGTGPELTPEETYQIAIEDFTQAIEATNAPDDLRNAARVGRARAYLQIGMDQEALADAREVPIGFTFAPSVYSTNSQQEQNDIWNMLTDSQRFSIAPEFRNVTVDGADDPRVNAFQAEDDQFAVDGSTPLYQARKYQSPTSPIRLASGLQAQYIIAEVQGGQEAIDIINQVREQQGIEATYDPSNPSQDELLRKILEERSRTLFLEGQRMGDLRRYLNRYDINLFPTGPDFGDRTCFPLPDAERDNNPDL